MQNIIGGTHVNRITAWIWLLHAQNIVQWNCPHEHLRGGKSEEKKKGHQHAIGHQLPGQRVVYRLFTSFRNETIKSTTCQRSPTSPVYTMITGQDGSMLKWPSRVDTMTLFQFKTKGSAEHVATHTSSVQAAGVCKPLPPVIFRVVILPPLPCT